MKKLIFTLLAVAFFGATALAQSKSMVIYKGGVKMYEQHVSNVDSVVFQATPDTVMDVDGNVYRTITFTIGENKMTWMVDNLKTTKLNDGTPIEEVLNVNARYQDGTSAGDFRMTPAFCWHMNQPYNKHIYGGLYNHLAIQTGKLAPKGWHVATNAEWTVIENYLGTIAECNNDGVAVFDGTALKVAKSMASQFTWSSTSAWQEIGNAPNKNNKSGLSLVACGFRDGSGWGQVGGSGFYWTATKGTIEGTPTAIGTAYSRNINSSTRGFDPAATPTGTGITSQIKQNGIQVLFGVRCVKDY